MKIEILGTGCPKSRTLADNVKAAAAKLGLEYELAKGTQIQESMKRGVMLTPALAIDGQVVCSGKVLSEAEATTLLAGAAQA